MSVGSIFGRPYNARPLVPRTTTDSVGILFPYPSPDGDLGWSKSSGRWEKEKAENQRINMTRVRSIEAECQNDFMKIRIRFNGSFSGIIYSTGEWEKSSVTLSPSACSSFSHCVYTLGFAYDPLCVYVNGTGRDYYEFFIQLNRCGTLGGNTHNLDSRKQPTVSPGTTSTSTITLGLSLSATTMAVERVVARCRRRRSRCNCYEMHEGGREGVWQLLGRV